MMYRLLKRDQYTLWTAAFLALGAAALFPYFAQAFSDGFIARLLIPQVVLIAAINLSFALRAQLSTTRFHAALPIEVRHIYISRAVAMLALVWMPLMAGAVSIRIFQPVAGAAWPTGMIQLACALSLGVLVTEFVALFEIQQPLKIVRFIHGAILGLPALTLMLPAPPVILVSLLLCATFLAFAWNAVPSTLQVAPQGVPTLAAAPKTPPTFALKWRPLLRTVWPWRYALWLPLLFGQEMFGTGMLMAPFLGLQTRVVRPQLRWLHALPIHPRTVALMMAVPMLFAVTIGYAIAAFGFFDYPPYHVHTSTQKAFNDTSTLEVIPSYDFWKRAEGGRAPIIVAPWGETFQPSTEHIYGIDAYNPFAVGPHNTQRFFDWQFARATTAVNGEPIPNADYLTSKNGYTPRRRTVLPTRIILITLFTMTAYILSIPLLTGMLDWYRLYWMPPGVRLLFCIPLLAPILLMIDQVRPRRDAATAWMSWLLPDSTPLVVAGFVLLLAALCWAANKVVCEAESVDGGANAWSQDRTSM